MPSPTTNHTAGRTRRPLFVIAGIAALALILLGGGSYLLWDTIAESRRRARAEEAVRTALNQWCSNQPLGQTQDTATGDFFDEFVARTSFDLRPTGYEITGVTRVKTRTFEVAATLTFPGGPETRVYKVEIYKKSGKCSITTKASEDVSGTELHARSILRAWLDSWVAGEDMATFKTKHPEAAAKMTMDVTWASLTAAGKRLVQYDISNATPAPGGGYRFTVTAIIEDRGTPETKILRYDVFKDRTLSQGRWTITGM
jgi:hypothetical protein